MAIRTDAEAEVRERDEEAEQLDDEAVESTEASPEDQPPGEEIPHWRPAIAVAFPVAGAAIMLGGIFTGIAPRFYAVIAGLLGVGLAVYARKITKPVRSTLIISAGIFGIGLLMLLPTGPANIFDIRRLLAAASSAGDLLRPPVPFVPGWHAVVGFEHVGEVDPPTGTGTGDVLQSQLLDYPLPGTPRGGSSSARSGDLLVNG